MQIRREFSTAGRLGRGAFWLRNLLFLPIALFVCIAADSLLGSAFGLVAALATTAFLVSVWGRRLHDRGRSAWWLLLSVVPVLGALLLMIECGLRSTRPAAERFGPATGRRTDYATVRATPSGGMP